MADAIIRQGDSAVKGKPRFFVEDQTDAFGIQLYALIERGTFEDFNWEGRPVRRDRKVLRYTTDEGEARREARCLNRGSVAS